VSPLRRWLEHRGAMVVLVLVVAALSISLHLRGHGWGDDFTLYLRQSKSLIDGNIGQVISDNHFNVDNAAKPGFSPYVYPWGFPILLAPFYRLFGLDYARLKLVEVVSLCGFLWFFHELLRRRMPKWLAFGTVAAVGTTLTYLRHTDSLLSEYPYMLVAAITLWWLDRCRRNGPLDTATRSQLITLGLLAMAVFNTRREGLAIVPAIAIVQLIDLRTRWHSADLRRAATPYVAFALGVIVMQFMLPSAIAPSYDGAGLHQTWRKLQGPFRAAFADQLGFPQLRSVGLGAVCVLAVAGMVVRLRRDAAADAPLIVFAVGSMVIVGMIPAQSDRYMLGVTPFALYFAVQAIAALKLPRLNAPWLAMAAVGMLILAHVAKLPDPIGDVRRANASGAVVDGPESPYAQAGFAAIRTYTRQDDVVAFFKARALTFYTNRRAVQSSELEIVRERADYFLMRRGSTFSQPLVTDSAGTDMGWTVVWQDGTWVLWRLTPFSG
jgi:hypothetical protein